MYKNFLGFAGRVATKPANEALAEADLIVFVGSDFPFWSSFLLIRKPILFRLTLTPRNLDVGTTQMSRC